MASDARSRRAAGSVGWHVVDTVAALKAPPITRSAAVPAAKGTGRWKRVRHGNPSTRWFGAAGDGATDERAVIASSAALARAYGARRAEPGIEYIRWGGAHRMTMTIPWALPGDVREDLETFSRIAR